MAAAVAASEYKQLPDDELRRYALGLGIDPVGPRATVVTRIDRHWVLQRKLAPAASNGAASNGAADASKAAKAGKAADTTKKRRRKKRAGGAAASTAGANDADADADASTTNHDAAQADTNGDVVIEYVPEALLFADAPDDAFAQVLAKFTHAAAGSDGAGDENGDDEAGAERERDGDEMDVDGDDDDDGEAGADGKSGSKKKIRRNQRLTVAELKQLVRKPEVVEWVDVTAADPKLLVSIKACRNTVPVPAHWQQKRKYLQAKRGLEKAPFDLPDFIKQTGIMQMREAVREKEDSMKLKGKTRERMQPKMGKIEIDYQKLHDAFFRWQTKPRLSAFGDIYYEGKEFETKLKLKKPGDLSEELKMALNIPPLAPPPWLINMQRYGPPPSYPQLKVPGLNAPIPQGAQWGYHPGGWGKPPVDEANRPLYGDVFGIEAAALESADAEPVDKTLWGELEPEPEEEEEEEEEGSEDEEDEDEGAAGHGGQLPPDGLVTPSGLSSVPSGLETPEFIELRKRPTGVSAPAPPEAPKQLYKVIEQKESAIKGFMGSQYVYDLESTTTASGGPAGESAAAKAAAAKRKLGITSSSIDVALNPEDLTGGGIDEATLKRKFEQQTTAKRAEVAKEDFSDLVAEHAAGASAKRQKKAGGDGKKDKTKEFKF
ncbi:hypothetical protein BC831DRAFT_510202 [Entophlyctis helioformis]|nr:hypothetical protein BC831DRAFT_510202 [Entophlyctis helioformis]